MKLNPYLAFDGRCREAFEFYQKALGGQITFIQTIGESPMASSTPAEAHRRIMHVTLQIGNQVLQGADAPPGQFTKPAGFCVAAPKSATVTGKAAKGFTDEERAAMKERAQELKAEARRGRRAQKADGEGDALAKIAEMPEPDRAMASGSMPSSKPARQPSRREPGTGCPRTARTAMSSASSKARTSSRRDTRCSASATRRTSTKAPCGRSPSR